MAISGVYSERARSATYNPRREVYEPAQIPHLWAHGLPDGARIRRGGRNNYYAEGDTIYSYGAHFPIARRLIVPDRGAGDRRGAVVFLFTDRRYSVTTAGHIRATQSAIPHGAEVYYLPPHGPGGVPLWDALARRDSRPIVEHYERKISDAAERAAAPRIRATTRARIMREIEGILSDWRRIHARFGLRCAVDRVKGPRLLEEVRARVAKERAKVERAERAAEEAAEEAVRAELAAEEARAARREALALPHLDNWRRGEGIYVKDSEGEPRVTVHSIRYPVLRIDAGPEVDPRTATPGPGWEVETSQGARVPLEEARRALAILPRLLERAARSANREGCADEGERIGAFGGICATPRGLRIGCHMIPYGEVRAFCAFYGWEVPANLPA